MLSGVLGDYSKVASMDTFTATSNDRHATEIAHLAGSRVVTASETQAGKRWDEAKVKSLSGGEPVSARFMRQDFFTFTPQFKLVFVGNHKPALSGVDDAMKRRIQMVPFTVKPERVDRELGEKLRKESPSILAWMVEGCLEWQAIGLAAPAAVVDATAEYFGDEDGIGQWLDEECETGEEVFTDLRDLYANFRGWRYARSEQAGTQSQLAQALANRGFYRRRHSRHGRIVFKSIKLRPASVDVFSDTNVHDTARVDARRPVQSRELQLELFEVAKRASE